MFCACWHCFIGSFWLKIFIRHSTRRGVGGVCMNYHARNGKEGSMEERGGFRKTLYLEPEPVEHMEGVVAVVGLWNRTKRREARTWSTYYMFFSPLFQKTRRGFFWDLFFSFVLLHITTMAHRERKSFCVFFLRALTVFLASLGRLFHYVLYTGYDGCCWVGEEGGWGGGDCLLLFIFDPYHLLLL